MAESDLRVEYERPGVLFASCGHMLINLWTTAVPDGAHLMELGRATRRVRDASGQKITLMVVLANAALPDAAQRQMLESYYSSHSNCFGAVCQVIEGSGLWAQTVRGILMTLNLIQPSKYPTGVFRSVRAAEAWAAQHNPSLSKQQRVVPIYEQFDVMRMSA